MDQFVAWVRRFVRELRRRRVLRVAVVYAGTAFVILQLGEILVEPFGLPGWTLRLVTFLLILGFPLAVGLAWVFDVTEEGLVRTGRVDERGGEGLGPGGKPLTSDAVIIGLLVLIAAFVIYPRLTGPAEQSPSEEAQGGPAVPEDTATARLGPKSVGVLPFTYLAAEDSTDYFSLGMTDELTTRLSQVEDLSVIARTSVMQYQGTEKTIPEIARELGVAHVVEGSVQKVGGKVRIQTQLIDAREGEHLWAKGFTRPFQDVLGLQSEVARQIAGQLEAKLLPREKRQLAEGRVVDSTAYALYLRGRKLRFRETAENLTEAVRLLRQSVQVDSTFAPAWAVLSTAAWTGPAIGGELPQGVDGVSLGRRAARKALQLDSTSAAAHLAMGSFQMILEGNYLAAGRHLRRAAELSPGLASPHFDPAFSTARDVARKAARKAVGQYPSSGGVKQTLSRVYFARREYKRSLRHIHTAGVLWGEEQWSVPCLKAWNQFYLGRPERALQLAEEGKQGRRPTIRHLFSAMRGFIFARTGRPDSARSVLERLRGEEGGPSPFHLGPRALLHLGLGNKEAALDLLEQIARRAREARSWYVIWLPTAPWYDPLRDHPRFQAILERLGLGAEAGAVPG